MILQPEQVRASIEGVHYAGRVGNPIPTAGHQVAESYEELRALTVEADAFISHMLYRGSWPEDRYGVERLIGRLRAAENKHWTPGPGDEF